MDLMQIPKDCTLRILLGHTPIYHSFLLHLWTIAMGPRCGMYGPARSDNAFRTWRGIVPHYGLCTIKQYWYNCCIRGVAQPEFMLIHFGCFGNLLSISFTLCPHRRSGCFSFGMNPAYFSAYNWRQSLSLTGLTCNTFKHIKLLSTRATLAQRTTILWHTQNKTQPPH